MTASEFLLRKIPNEYVFKKNYLDSNSNTLKVLFLGNSHILLGIDPSLMSVPSFNAAQVSQSLDYDYEILKKYENRWDSLQYVVLNFDYSNAFRRLSNDPNESWREKYYNIYFGINTSWRPDNNFEVLNGTIINTAHKIWNHYYWRLPDFSSTNLGYCVTYASNPKLSFSTSGYAAYLKHKPYNHQNFRLNIISLGEIISFCKHRDIKLIILSTPCRKEYNAHLEKNLISIINRSMDSIVQANSMVTYISPKQIKSFTTIDFFDADHLNIRGAKKLTAAIDSMVRL